MTKNQLTVGHARLSPEMAETLKSFVAGKVVLDVGCGDLSLSLLCHDLGASQVIALDKERPKRGAPRSVIFVQMTFKEYLLTSNVFLLLSQLDGHASVPIDVAILSWPPNYDGASFDIVEIIRQIPTVIYIGCNTGGSQCGTPYLWRALTKRNILCYYPVQPGTEVDYPTDAMLVYGDQKRQTALVREEQGGIDDSKIYEGEEQ